MKLRNAQAEELHRAGVGRGEGPPAYSEAPLSWNLPQASRVPQPGRTQAPPHRCDPFWLQHLCPPRSLAGEAQWSIS